MPEPVAASADTVEFSRIIDLARLRDGEDFAFELTPSEAEAKALARLMGALSVRKLRFAGRLVPAGAGWRLEARLGATAVQPCVVSLEPVTTRVDVPVRRTYLPEAAPAPVDLDLADEEADEVEPLPDRLDLGLVATEALALALPAYPRKAGAVLGPSTFAADGVRPLEDADVKPFSALATLRDKLGKGS